MQPETIFTCPHCNEEINHLKYSCSRAEFGTCDLTVIEFNTTRIVDANNYEMDDSGDSDDYSFDCPECGETVRPNRILFTEKKPKKKEQEERIEIISPKHFLRSENGNLEDMPSMPCKKCRKVVIFSLESTKFDWRNMKGDISATCPHCGTLNNPSKYFKEFKQRQESRRRKNKKLQANFTP